MPLYTPSGRRSFYVIDFNTGCCVGRPYETPDEAIEFVETQEQQYTGSKRPCFGVLQLVASPTRLG